MSRVSLLGTPRSDVHDARFRISSIGRQTGTIIGNVYLRMTLSSPRLTVQLSQSRVSRSCTCTAGSPKRSKSRSMAHDDTSTREITKQTSFDWNVNKNRVRARRPKDREIVHQFSIRFVETAGSRPRDRAKRVVIALSLISGGMKYSAFNCRALNTYIADRSFPQGPAALNFSVGGSPVSISDTRTFVPSSSSHVPFNNSRRA